MPFCRQKDHCRAIWLPLVLMLVALSGWVFFQQAQDSQALYATTLLVVGVVILEYLSNDSRT